MESVRGVGVQKKLIQYIYKHSPEVNAAIMDSEKDMADKIKVWDNVLLCCSHIVKTYHHTKSPDGKSFNQFKFKTVVT